MSSSKLEGVKKWEGVGEVGLATFSDWVKSTSKLRVLLIVSMELANEMCEQADEGRDKIGAP